MALKAMMIRRKMETAKNNLEELRGKDQDYKRREEELEDAIKEAETEEEQKAVTEEIDAFVEDKENHETEKNNLIAEIERLEAELEEEEKKIPDVSRKKEKAEGGNTRMTETINIRALPMNKKVIKALPHEERERILKQDDVKTFLSQLRGMKGQSRAITGGELTIPIVFLELIAENMYRYSKLINRVRVQDVRGQARQTIAGTVPEAIWTEMCGAINELTFTFNQVTLDGYKVAGFVPVCNTLLDDNDVNLASWIVEMIAESIGFAIDKAILYGKGTSGKMPLGIVTRLAQQSKPADYPANAPEWEDLHTTNLIKIESNLTGAEFWAKLQVAAGNTFTRYSRGNQFWAMNSKTYAALKSKAITFTAAGDVVANVYGILPIVTGDIDVLEFMPDGDIVGGYGDLYLYAQRGDMTIESSREVQFIQDNTVFKGKQVADGMPVVPGAFVAININGTAPTTVMTFAADTANDAALNALSVGTETLAPTFKADVYAYTVTAAGTSAKIEAIPEQAGAQVEIQYNGKNVRNGGTVTWATGAYPLTVTVKQGNAVRVYTVTVTKAEE